MPKKSRANRAPSGQSPQVQHIAPARVSAFLAAGIILIIFSLIYYFYFGESAIFWAALVIGIIIGFNAYWLRHKYASPFMIPFGLTMLKTKKFINFIRSMDKIAWWYEKLCLVGMFLGFGLAGVDYWYARKLGGWRRAAVLAFAGVAFISFFYFFLGILFAVPILAPLYIPCLIGFALLGFGGLMIVLLFGYGLMSLQGLFFGKQLCPTIAPVIPGAPIPGFNVSIPLLAWISLAMVLIIHEFSHGVMMSHYKEKIKSVGLILAGIFPFGAFVEQDDKTFNTLQDKKALMVLSAGSASNIASIAVAFALLFAIGFIAQPFENSVLAEYNKAYNGVKVLSVSDTVSFCGITVIAPAKGKLFAGDIVKSVNGVDVNSTTSLSNAIAQFKGDVNYDFVVQRADSDTNLLRDVNVFVAPYKFEDLGIRRIGIEFASIETGYKPDPALALGQGIYAGVLQVLFFFGLLSFAAGSFNYVPSDPFDGGRMAKIILEPYFGFMGLNRKETRKLIGRLFVWLLVISLLLNMIPYLTML